MRVCCARCSTRISTAGDDTAIVTAVIGMARSLKLRVVAEGVETLEELEFLRAHRCDEAQGFYFSRPLTDISLSASLCSWDQPDERGPPFRVPFKIQRRHWA